MSLLVEPGDNDVENFVISGTGADRRFPEPEFPDNNLRLVDRWVERQFNNSTR